MIANFLKHFRGVLTYREMLGLSWQLAWPAVALDTVWSLVVIGLFDADNPFLQTGSEILFLLFMGPWIVRRMFQRSYETFQLKSFRGGLPSVLGHAESFKACWLLIWRTTVATLVAGMISSAFLGLVKIPLSSLVPNSKEAPLFNAIGMSVVMNGVGLFLLPLVMPGMFAKRYQGFRLLAERKAPGSGVAQPRHQQHPAKHQKRS